MKTILIAAAAATSILLAGCGTTGNQALGSTDQATINQRVVPGKTTKSDVRNFLGAPDDINLLAGGQEVWQYTQATTKVNAASFIPVVGLFAGGTTVDQKIFVILFDKKGTVQKAEYSAKVNEYRNGVTK